MNRCKFTIVIPLFNREREIGRALTSCLNEMDDQFEIVVVDDASTDGSVAAVEPFLSDSRVKLVVSEMNKGEWAARTAGIASARGEWIIGLDSDDEFLRGGLSLIQAAVEDHGAEFERLGFEYVYDIGGKSPLPEISLPTVLDLPGYLRWYSEIERADALWVTKRKTFTAVPLPDGRNGHLLYAFAFNSTYRTLLLPITAGAVHTDSGNRLSSVLPRFSVVERNKADGRRIECDALLGKYGDFMLEVSRPAHRRLSRMRVFSAILSGGRLTATKNLLFHAKYHLSVEVVSLFLLILAGPRITQFLNACRLRRLSQNQVQEAA